MAKVFKIIMNIILIVFIAAFCAVIVPPLLGITTSVAMPSTETNMKTGSIAYGVKYSLEDLNAGDNIIVNTTDANYIYEIVDIDASDGNLTVRDSKSAETVSIQLRRTASKSIIVVPFIGYIYIAFQSTEGLMILGLAAGLVIILFVIASIVCSKGKSRDEDEDEAAEDDSEYFRDLAAGTSRPNRLDELGTITMAPVREESAAEPIEAQETISLDEEIEEVGELILEPVEAPGSSLAEEVSDIPEPMEKEVAAVAQIKEEAFFEEDRASLRPEYEEKPAKVAADELFEIGSALENILESKRLEQNAQEPKHTAPVSPKEDAPAASESDEIEIAIPIYTLDQLLKEAYAKGEDPHVRKDNVTGVTFVDYSSCF